MGKICAAITGVQGYLPDYILTNQELERMVETSDAWITERTGIKERRILKGSRGTSFMGIEAGKQLLEKKSIDPLSIDMVICATVTPDMLFPATANIIAKGIGAENSFGYDINAACSGFLYALTTAARFVESGSCKRVLVIGADKMSSIIDYTDRSTCIIFGDGAGAVLLEPSQESNGLIDSFFRVDGQGEEFLYMPAGGSRQPASHETVDARAHFVKQEGRTVFKFAIKNMADAAEKIMQRNALKGTDIRFLVPHQANKRIIDATAERIEIGSDKVMVNIHRYGNTTGGTIPLCLWDYEKQLKKGDKLVLASFGGGFTWGATYLKWAY